MTLERRLHRIAAAALAAAPALLVGAGARAESVRHLPPAEADAGAPIELSAEVDRAWRQAITVHYRPVGGAWAAAEFQRTEDAWVAVIPGEAVAPPGVEYFIDSRGESGEPVPEFASQAAPHLVVVRPSGDALRRQRDLARAGGRRSRIEARAEWVDFGTRRFSQMDGTAIEIPDRYYRVDASFSYLLLAYPLKAVRIGYTRLFGTTPNAHRDEPMECADRAACEIEAGFKVGGWFELRFSLVDGVELDGRGTVMATSEGFAVGGRGELRVGVEDGSHVALGGELAADVGASAFFRLGWDTVPRFPMATTVELLDYPANRRAAGVRLIHDVAHAISRGVRLGLRLSYQARDERIGGLGGGVTAQVDF